MEELIVHASHFSLDLQLGKDCSARCVSSAIFCSISFIKMWNRQETLHHFWIWSNYISTIIYQISNFLRNSLNWISFKCNFWVNWLTNRKWNVLQSVNWYVLQQVLTWQTLFKFQENIARLTVVMSSFYPYNTK